MPRKHSAMSGNALAGVLLDLGQRAGSPGFPQVDPSAPDPLLWGLPQSAILKATFGRDQFGPYADVVVRNRRPLDKKHLPHTEANPRRLDPEAFALVRLLLLPGDTVYLDTASRKDVPDEEKLYYLEILASLGITVLRLVTDAQADQVVNEADDHHELRRGFLTLTTTAAREAQGKRNRGSYRTRAEAFETALANFDKAAISGELPAPLSRDQYRVLLETYARLLDERPLGIFASQPQAG